ncbi:hypothetical protein ACS0TY_028224 [Phlomoides rotata]
MENQNKQLPPPPETDSVTTPPASVTPERKSDDHISLSSPVDSPMTSPAGSCSSPLHSKHSSGEHISLSPPVGSPGNSPPRSSLASEHSTISHSHLSSPGIEKPLSPESEKPHPPETVVVRKDVFKEPVDDRVVVEEPMAVVRRAVFEEPKAVAAKTDRIPSPEVVGRGGGSGRLRLSILRRAEREKMVRKAALGFRVFGFLFCLISFSVMAADRNQGWALDSFNNYKEFRYCMSVNIIGFMYSGAQAFDLSYNLATGKYNARHQQLRYYFDFAFDQVIAYLLISASSSATIRIEDWQFNWGKDTFPNMATASISMSFLAFTALASTSLISGYALCTLKSL